VTDERLLDAALAAGALATTLVVVVAADVAASQPSLAAGVLGALLVEFALQWHQNAVRAAWGRPLVKAATVAVFLAALALSWWLAPATGLSVLAGGLVGYLALLAGSTLGDAVGG
jgi:hypothetical protein